MARDDDIERLERLADHGDPDAAAALERARRRRGAAASDDLIGLVLVDPSDDTWRFIWETAPTWDDATLERADALLDEHWPDALRTMPPDALRTLVGHASPLAAQRRAAATAPSVEPRWRLVRRIEAAAARRHAFDRVALGRLREARELDALTQLALDDQPITRHTAGAGDRPLEDLFHLQRLERLEVSGCGLGDAGAAVLSRGPDFQRLRHLGLGRNLLTDRALTHLDGSPAAQGLVHLDLAGNAITPAGMHTLAGGDLTELAHLALDENAIGLEGVEALAGAPLTRLTTLGLSTARLGSSAVRTLVGAAWAPRLRVLDLSNNEIGVIGVAALVDSPCFAGLERLRLARTGLRRGALATLANRDTEGVALRDLDLSGNPLSVDGLRALLEAPWLDQLEHLALGDRRLDPFLAETLAACGRLSSLRRLDVPALAAPGGQRLAAALLRSPNLPLAARLGLLEPMSLNWLRQLASTTLGIASVARLDETELRAAIRAALPVASDDVSATG